MSEQVKRYIPRMIDESVAMVYHSDGEYVTHGDYAALQAELAEANRDFYRVAKELDELKAELSALKAQTPEYGPAPAVSIKWHESPESVHREMWESVAIGEGMTYEQLMADSDICAEDEDGNEVVLESDADIKGMKAQGCWAFVDIEAQTIHAWADKSVDDGLLIHMLAHEIGHATGKPDKDGIREEFRAEQFGSVAALAYSLFTDWRKNHSAQDLAPVIR